MTCRQPFALQCCFCRYVSCLRLKGMAMRKCATHTHLCSFPGTENPLPDLHKNGCKRVCLRITVSFRITPTSFWKSLSLGTSTEFQGLAGCRKGALLFPFRAPGTFCVSKGSAVRARGVPSLVLLLTGTPSRFLPPARTTGLSAY